MSNNWNLRADILEITHRWTLPFFAFLIGSLLGIGVSFLLPSPYRAESDLYVAYNADAIYRNPDDYKNWQLGELEAFTISQHILHETLTRLKAQDSYWENTSTDALRTMLYTYWRNAGKWRLVAENSEPRHTTQLVRIWREVIIDEVAEATSQAAVMLDLSNQIQTVLNSKVTVEMQRVQLTQMKEALQTWVNEAEGQKVQQPLETLERWNLQTVATSVAAYNPVALPLLEKIPPPDAPSQDYLPWVERFIVVVDNDLAIVQEQSTKLTDQHDELTLSWEEASDASHGLTAFLVVEPLSDTNLVANPVRLTSQMALVGGLLGVLIWGLFWLGRPIRETRK